MFSTGVMLETHLRYNHFPPVDPIWLTVCQDAIEAGSDGEWDAEIDTPKGVLYRGKEWLPANEVVRMFHLEDFIQSPEIDDDGLEDFDYE